MYNHYYGFQEKPFSLTPDPHFFYLSSVHRRALAYLTYGLEDKKGFITITGEIGAGKTTLIRALIKRLDPNTTVARIINTKVSSFELLKMIARDFGIDKQFTSKEELLNHLNNFLLEQYSMGHNSVLIIDEAQNLEPATLEEIRLLSNLETEKDKLLQIILVGQPELRQILALPELKQLRQRITVGYHISSLTREEVAEYIRHRLTVAGGRNKELFTPEATDLIYRYSGGIPRLINIICDAALVTGYVENVQRIDADLIREVIEELDLDLAQGEIKEAVHQNAGGGTADRQLQELAAKVEELFTSYKSRQAWEAELAQKEQELKAKEEELYLRLKELIKLEEELLAREKLIRAQEAKLGISKV